MQDRFYLMNQTIFDYGLAYLLVQLMEGLHFIHRNYKKHVRTSAKKRKKDCSFFVEL